MTEGSLGFNLFRRVRLHRVFGSRSRKTRAGLRQLQAQLGLRQQLKQARAHPPRAQRSTVALFPGNQRCGYLPTDSQAPFKHWASSRSSIPRQGFTRSVLRRSDGLSSIPRHRSKDKPSCVLRTAHKESRSWVSKYRATTKATVSVRLPHQQPTKVSPHGCSRRGLGTERKRVDDAYSR